MRYRLPEEYAHDEKWRGLARWIPSLVFFIVPIGLGLWRGFTYQSWFAPLFAAFFGGSLGACAWESLSTGYTVGKSRLFHRRTEPGPFWFLFIIYFAAYLTITAALIFAKL